ncbi:hypothetical protein HanRHA438_Chr07g0310031 [Helianthus annuus]|nr:hypothetical protein HanRHA438_Chr07g0310031 [Helianthus annuus]
MVISFDWSINYFLGFQRDITNSKSLFAFIIMILGFQRDITNSKSLCAFIIMVMSFD